MPETRLDVLCVGNAIVDVIANANDEFLSAEGLVKGSMRLIDAEEAETALRLCAAMRRFWRRHGHINEGRRWIESVLGWQDRVSNVLRMKVLISAAFLAENKDSLTRTVALFTEGLALARSLGAP